jgi:hypothetical protein
MSLNAEKLAQGADNLLLNCANTKIGDRVLILHEDPALGWYDLAAPQAVADACHRLGTPVFMKQVPGPDNSSDKGFTDLFTFYEIIIFFARMGDQDRFEDPAPGKTVVMSYIRDAEMLASPYGTIHYQALVDLKEAVNEVFLSAEDISVTCSSGTDFSGFTTADYKRSARDVGVRRFPMGVHIPLTSANFGGKIALNTYLTPTGSKVYEPAVLDIPSTVMAYFAAGEITSFEGPNDSVKTVQDHYNHVADLFDLDWKLVDSWHAGIHPGLSYQAQASDDPDRWSNTVFTSPRFLHIHTCGHYPPGEVCLMVHNPSITVDGTVIWKDGVMKLEDFPQAAACLDKWEDLKNSYDNPSLMDGLS